MWLVQHPGHITVNWFGEVVNAPAALLLITVALVAIIIWSLVRFVVGIPSFVLAVRAGSGDARKAMRRCRAV